LIIFLLGTIIFLEKEISKLKIQNEKLKNEKIELNEKLNSCIFKSKKMEKFIFEKNNSCEKLFLEKIKFDEEMKNEIQKILKNKK